jgi:lactate dehydrogenase-like 2-hydroxyacid dehydrogenase
MSETSMHPTPVACWICGRPADSGEHVFKASELKRLFDKDGYSFDDLPFYFHSEGHQRIPGPNSKRMKYPKLICSRCNNDATSDFDHAYNRLSDWFATQQGNYALTQINFREIFGTDFLDGINGFRRHCAKSLGCRILASGYLLPLNFPNPVKDSDISILQLSICYAQPFRELKGLCLSGSPLRGAVKPTISRRTRFATQLLCRRGLPTRKDCDIMVSITLPPPDERAPRPVSRWTWDGDEMSKPEVLMIGPYPAWDLDPLERDYSIHRLWEAEDRELFIAKVASRVRAIATRGELGADAALIDALPGLEIVSCYGMGTDAIDLARAKARNVRVTNTPEVLTNDVADMALALILACLRKIPQGDAYVRSGQWTKKNMDLATSLTGKTVGILGFGRIGRAVAQRAIAFETKVAYSDVSPASGFAFDFYPDAPALAKASDILVVTVAGGAATKNIVGAQVLESLGPNGVLINVARGTIVDEAALVDAISRGTIGGAGLDVFWNEPNIDKRLLEFPNVIVQPHQSSGTIETRKAMGQLVRDNLAAHFSGRPLLTPVV